MAVNAALGNQDPGKDVFLLGNEAIARGALEAGIQVATGYPGNPSSEILGSLNQLAPKLGFYSEWSVNEKVAMEVAAAASFAGLRSLVTMKMNGLNVCADFLTTVNLTGCNGGFVCVTCDDPGALSSGNEQDSRHYARFCQLPMLEPGTCQEAKEMMRYAFEISEEFSLPVLFRSVSRLSHGQGPVALGDLPRLDRVPFYDTSKPFLAAPPRQSYLHQALLQKIAKIRKRFDECQFNTYFGPVDAQSLIITSGLGSLFSKEAVHLLALEDKVGILNIGTPWPLPEGLIKHHLATKTRVLFVENTDPFLETEVMALAAGLAPATTTLQFFGQKTGTMAGPFGPGIGELATEIVVAALAKMEEVSAKCIEPRFKVDLKTLTNTRVPPRIPSFCEGCSHRASFWAINTALKLSGEDIFVAGDIGCYGLSMGPTGFNTTKVLHCMGAGYGMASGFGVLSKLGMEQKVVAVVGDSTFYHAAIPALLNARMNGADILFIVLDNGATSMTGHQPNPGSGRDSQGVAVEPVLVEDLCTALHIPVVAKDPLNIHASISEISAMLEMKGPRLLVLRSPCAIQQARETRADNIRHLRAHVDQDKCIGNQCGCGAFCTKVLGCPGNAWDSETGKAYIDERFCNACNLCVDLCPVQAISLAEARH